MTTPSDLAALDREKYLRLTTFRRDGTPVPTPVWFAVDGDSILVVTEAASGKVKRLRNNPAVEVVVCDARGRVRPGAPVRTGTARLVDDPARGRRADDLLNRKYGPVKRAMELVAEARRFLRREGRREGVVLEVTLDATP